MFYTWLQNIECVTEMCEDNDTWWSFDITMTFYQQLVQYTISRMRPSPKNTQFVWNLHTIDVIFTRFIIIPQQASSREDEYIEPSHAVLETGENDLPSPTLKNIITRIWHGFTEQEFDCTWNKGYCKLWLKPPEHIHPTRIMSTITTDGGVLVQSHYCQW